MAQRRLGEGTPEERAPASEAVLVPVFQEQGAIGPFLAELAPYAKGRRVYVLDSDSPDRTVPEARRAGARNGLDLVVLACPRGLAAAIRHGVEQSTEARLAVIDGDGQHPPAVLDGLFGALAAGCDLAVGSRFAAGATVAQGWPKHRQLVTNVLLLALRFGGRCHGVTDPLAGCFALQRAAWQRVRPRFETGGFKFLLDFLTAAPRLRVAETPIAFRSREAGASKVAFRVSWELLVSLAWNVLRGRVPRRFVGFGTVGALGTLVDASVTGILHAMLGLPFWLARPGSLLAGMTHNYTLNNALTFFGRRRRGVGAFARGWLLYGGTQAVGSLANYTVSVTLQWAGLWWLAAVLGGTAAGMTLNYLSASKFVWGQGRGHPNAPDC